MKCAIPAATSRPTSGFEKRREGEGQRSPSHTLCTGQSAMTNHRVTLSNRGSATFDVAENEVILDICEQAGVALPVACRYGGCITCAARLVSGKVVQPNGTALKQAAVEGGLHSSLRRPPQKRLRDRGRRRESWGLVCEPVQCAARRSIGDAFVSLKTRECPFITLDCKTSCLCCSGAAVSDLVYSSSLSLVRPSRRRAAAKASIVPHAIIESRPSVPASDDPTCSSEAVSARLSLRTTGHQQTGREHEPRADPDLQRCPCKRRYGQVTGPGLNKASWLRRPRRSALVFSPLATARIVSKIFMPMDSSVRLAEMIRPASISTRSCQRRARSVRVTIFTTGTSDSP